MTPNNSTGLLESFQRFAQLSTFHHRANTPNDLVLREQAEYLSLLANMTPMIQRLQAFADLSTDKLLDVAATRASQGWRMLEPGEMIQAGDEIGGGALWSPVEEYQVIGLPVAHCQHGVYRRRVAPAVPKPVQDTAESSKASESPVLCDCGASELLSAAKDLLEKWDNQRKEPGWVKRWLAAKDRMSTVIAKHDTAA